MPNELILLTHAASGVLGCMAALWVFIEALNGRKENAARIRTAALMTAIFISAAWLLGGYWYVHDYPSEKAMILAGPWPFAHNVFMETKEHLFFVTGVLALLLPIATRETVFANSAARKLVLCVSASIALTGLALEGAGAVVDHGVKVGLIRGAPKGR
jgi:hypothetical protein